MRISSTAVKRDKLGYNINSKSLGKDMSDFSLWGGYVHNCLSYEE